MFKAVYNSRDKMPVYHYPLPINDASQEILFGEHLHTLNKKSIHVENNNLYIHIPFCRSICNFCSFTKWVASQDKISIYLEYLKDEIEMYAQMPFSKSIKFSAIYFGGGTPSLLSAEQLIDLLTMVKEKFNISKDCEVTIEGSPSSFSREKFQKLREHGVTRVSMGAQTLNDKLTAILGIPQNPDRTKMIVKDALHSNFDAVSMDFIYNIPTQTLEDWRNDIKTALALGVNQLTLFPLTVAPFTKLGKKIKNGELPKMLPQANEFEYYSEAIEILQDNGFRQLTNVDWLRPGSKYKYCEQHFSEHVNILGIGVGAFGEMNGVSYINTGNLDEYYNIVSKSKFPIKKYALVEEELPYQYIALSLRCLKLSDLIFKERFGVSIFDMFGQKIEEAEKKGLIEIKGSEIRVTTLGAFYLYDLSREFVSEKYVNVNPYSSSIEIISKT